MKPLNKVVLTAACGLLTFGGACLTFVQAQQPREKISDLTLANIEALALYIEYGNIASCPWPADPYVSCMEITQFPDGKVVSVPIKGRGATYDPSVRP